MRARMQSPETTLAYALCTTEHFCGLILSALLLGVVVTKASIPTGKIVFSKVCLITTRCAPGGEDNMRTSGNGVPLSRPHALTSCAAHQPPQHAATQTGINVRVTACKGYCILRAWKPQVLNVSIYKSQPHSCMLQEWHAKPARAHRQHPGQLPAQARGGRLLLPLKGLLSRCFWG